MSFDFDIEYKKFISSTLWKQMRIEFIKSNFNDDKFRSCEIKENRYSCDGCGWNFPANKLEVHHKHYHKLFGHETRDDVMVLCSECHKKYDKIRARQGRERSEIALNNARYMGGFISWLRKKYCEDDINFYIDDEHEHELFQEFIEREDI